MVVLACLSLPTCPCLPPSFAHPPPIDSMLMFNHNLHKFLKYVYIFVTQCYICSIYHNIIYVIVKLRPTTSRIRGVAKASANNKDILQVWWGLTGFYPCALIYHFCIKTMYQFFGMQVSTYVLSKQL